jgi:hypothetical protein
MRVLITGGAGFVGSNVVAVAAERGDDVAAVVREPPPRPERRCRYLALDLLDAEAVRAALTDVRPDVVVHAAIWNDFAGIYADGTFTDKGDGTWSWSFPTTDDVAGATDTVTASDGTGSTATDSFHYSAANANPVLGTPSNTSQSNCSASISATFTDVGTADTHTATIAWGDGNTTDQAAVTESNGSGTVTGSHTYGSPGTYNVTVTVTDDDGGGDTSDSLVVNNNPQVSGNQPPIIAGKTFNIGSTIPVKVIVTGCVAGLSPKVWYATHPAGTTTSPSPAGKSSKLAGQMRYDASLPGFIYNWQTKGINAGIYDVVITDLPGASSPFATVTLVK